MNKRSEKLGRVFQVGERVALRKPLKVLSPTAGGYIYLKFGTVKEVLRNFADEVVYAVNFDGYDNTMDLHSKHFDYQPQYVMSFLAIDYHGKYIGVCQAYKVSDRHITNYRAVTNQTSDLDLLLDEEENLLDYHQPLIIPEGYSAEDVDHTLSQLVVCG